MIKKEYSKIFEKMGAFSSAKPNAPTLFSLFRQKKTAG